MRPLFVSSLRRMRPRGWWTLCLLLSSTLRPAHCGEPVHQLHPLHPLHPRSEFERHVDLTQDEVCRIQEHLERIESLLCERSVEGLPAWLQQAREQNLERLHAYRLRGIFPRNTRFPSRLVPHFIDAGGRACAVAQLMIDSGAGETARAIARRANHAYLEDISDPELDRWIAESGLAPEECALIQPGYGRYWPSRLIETGIDLSYPSRAGPVRVTVDQHDHNLGFYAARSYVEVIRGPITPSHVTVQGDWNVSPLSDEPDRPGASGVLISSPPGFPQSYPWSLRYSVEIDAGVLTMEGRSDKFESSGDTFAELGPVPRLWRLRNTSPFRYARSIGQDCAGADVQSPAPGVVILEAHGEPLSEHVNGYQLQSDRLLFAFSEVGGDFQLEARMERAPGAAGFRGLMVRSSCHRRAKHLFLGEDVAAGTLGFAARWEEGSAFTFYDGPHDPPRDVQLQPDPRLKNVRARRLRLVRQDFELQGFVLDEEGELGVAGAWIPLAEPPIGGLPDLVFVGIAASSGEGCGAISRVVFEGCSLKAEPPPTLYRLGDVTSDGIVGIADPIRTLEHLFAGKTLECPPAADWNGSGKLEIADATRILGWLFLGEAPPPLRNPAECVAASRNSSLGSCAYARSLCPPFD